MEVGEFFFVGCEGGAAEDDAAAGGLVDDLAVALTGAGGEAGSGCFGAVGKWVGGVDGLIADLVFRPAPGDDVDIALGEFGDAVIDGFEIQFFSRWAAAVISFGAAIGATRAVGWEIF